MRFCFFIDFDRTKEKLVWHQFSFDRNVYLKEKPTPLKELFFSLAPSGEKIECAWFFVNKYTWYSLKHMPAISKSLYSDYDIDK